MNSIVEVLGVSSSVLLLIYHSFNLIVRPLLTKYRSNNLNLAKKWLLTEIEAILFQENLELGYQDNFDHNPNCLAYYRYLPKTHGTNDYGLGINIQVKNLYEKSCREELAILHELGHHFSLKERNDGTEKAANKWAKKFLDSCPFWIVIVTLPDTNNIFWDKSNSAKTVSFS